MSLNAWWTGRTSSTYGLARLAAPRVLFADRERVERIAPQLGGRGSGSHRRVRRDGPTLPAGVERWDDVRRARRAAARRSTIDPDDDATILYTSGTTGRPEGRRVDPPGRRAGAAWPSPAAPSSTALRRPRPRRRAAPAAARFILDRAALPRHRLRAGDARLGCVGGSSS